MGFRMPRKHERLVPFLIRLSSNDLDTLETIAEEKGTKKSILCRTAIKEYINRKKIRP